jgi:sugar lactone lactonase YvrE
MTQYRFRDANKSRWGILLAGILCFLLCVGVGMALADPGTDEPSAEVSPPAPELQVGELAASENSSVEASPETNPQTAVELPHSGLDREEVIDLVKGVFEPELQAPAAGFDELKVDKFLTNQAAVVSGGQGLEGAEQLDGSSNEHLLLESTIPLRTDGEEVDLQLGPSDEGLAPESPLVEVSIPEKLGEGISLPEAGVTIEVPGSAEERSPSRVENTALYPNIAADSDLVAAPTPTGVEILTTMRSPEAPRSQTFQLQLPAGAELRERSNGAIAVLAGEEILLVQEPTAMDAAGTSVPVKLTLSGDAVTVTAEPGSSTQWPVLVDPIFESYDWYGSGSTTGLSDWAPKNTDTNQLGLWHSALPGPYPIGLNAVAQPGSYVPGVEARWSHEVPRLEQGEKEGRIPTSYIAALHLSNVSIKTSAGTSSPYGVSGIWDIAEKNWAGKEPNRAVWGYPGNGTAISGAKVDFTSGNDHSAKLAIAPGFLANESTTSSGSAREFYIGTASVEIADDEAPKVTNPSGSAWINSTPKEPISATVSDNGLGAKAAQFTIPGQGQKTVESSCLGTVANPCSEVWTAQLGTSQFNPSLMPQGEDGIPIFGEDVVRNKSAAVKAQVLVDHTAPSLALSGNLTEQGTVGTKLPTYTLNYATADGEDAAATALTPYGTTGTGEGQLERPQGLAIDASGNIWVSDRVNNRIIEYGPNGGFIRQVNAHGSADGAISEPRGLTVSPAGNIWVAENGNKRLQEFSPTGAFIAKITNAAFVEPWGVTPGAGGTLWVSDPGAHKIFQFSESGTLLKTISGGFLSPLTSPYGIALDASGNIWVADTGANKIAEFDTFGSRIFSFGTEGTGNGQLKAPTGLAITPSGHIFVSEDQNARVQEFQPDGSYLRQFGSLGSAANQLSEPRQVVVGPENSLLIADAANHRIARWTHADQDPQSGVAKVEVKVDGNAAKNEAPGCSTKNCQLSSSGTLAADNYSVGSHKVEVTATDAVGLATTKTLTVETHGDRTPPSLALSGSMTEQGALGTTRPTYKLKLSATDPGSAEERKSGVAATTIKVDGKVVDSTSPGCPSEGCSITREWTLESSAYSAGAHTVEAIATDGAGHTTTKTLAITIERDTTAPALSATGELYVAPEGWIEQKEYSAFATATDEGGYGVTSLELKIDGAVVKASTGTCGAGGCSKFFFSGINMSKYSGGAHQAELIATDGAGNWKKRSWTLRVDPAGPVSAPEATSTIEAVEETRPEQQYYQPVAPTSEVLEPQEIEAGDNPQFIEEEGQLVSTGVTTSTEVDQATGNVTIEGTDGPLTIEPAYALEPAKLVEEAAAVLPATETAADTVIRPEYNGAEMFTTIRDSSAPENYSWRINMRFGQYLEQVDSQHIRVDWGNGEEAWMISAEPAHDALGHAVPTTLEVTENTNITLTVHHREAQVVYPVSAGESYITEYAIVTVEIPSPEKEAEEEGYEPAEEGLIVNEPLSQSELEDANGFELLENQGKHRDKEKPVPVKQSKQMERWQGLSQATSSGHVKEEPGELYDLHSGMCSGLNCPIWKAEYSKGTIKVKENAAEYWSAPACESHIDFWWTLNLTIDWEGIGHRRNEVKKGSGEHIAYWCVFTIKIYLVPDPDLPIPDEMDQKYSLQDWVFPNGYQARHVYKRPPPVIQN